MIKRTLLALTVLAPLAAGAEPMQATADVCFVNPVKSPPERQKGERVSPPPLQPPVMFRLRRADQIAVVCISVTCVLSASTRFRLPFETSWLVIAFPPNPLNTSWSLPDV
jgi:hypothetical protein